MPSGLTSYTQPDIDPLTPYSVTQHGAYKNFEFDYAAPAGEQDSMINNLKINDLVYVNTAGKIKKIAINSVTNATLKATQVGIVTGIQINDLKRYYSEYDFTADGGIITVLVGRNIQWYGDKVTIGNTVTSGADTRDAFSFATHCGSGAILEGLVRAESKANNRDLFSFL